MKAHRNAQYLAWLRKRPCVVTGREGIYGHAVVAHHVKTKWGGGGMGLKPSDYMCVPLLAEEHVRLHNIGEKLFWSQKGIDPIEMISMNLLVYLAASELRSDRHFVENLTCLIEETRSHKSKYDPEFAEDK